MTVREHSHSMVYGYAACELTMANHGNAYHLVVWPIHEPVSDNAILEFIRDNWEAIYQLCLEGNKHHKGINVALLYHIAVETLLDWAFEKYE